MERNGAVKQGQHSIKPGLRLKTLRFERTVQCMGLEIKALNVATNRQQTPAVIARHAIGLCAG